MAEYYCGPAPEPHSLLTAWNPDVIAIGLCMALVTAHFVRAGSERGSMIGVVAILAALYLSPLCALTVALFSARVLHHVLLIAIAAPLLAMAFPKRGGAGLRMPLAMLVGVHAAIVWFWHVPRFYEIGIGSALPYWIMQLSLLGSGFLLWRGILSENTPLGAAVLALLATTVQMGLLGALLVFAREPLYMAHLATALHFGITPLADQQLAGLIMWVPAALPYLVAAMLLLTRRFDRLSMQDSRQ